jgi:hypothetical protein
MNSRLLLLFFRLTVAAAAVVTKSGTILCLARRGEKGSEFSGYAVKALAPARCNLDWLTDGHDSLASAR